MQISSNCSFKNVFMSKRNVQKSCANILVCNIAHAINVIKDTNTVKSVTQDSPKDVWLDIQTPWSEGKLNQQWWWSCYFLNKRPCREKKKKLAGDIWFYESFWSQRVVWLKLRKNAKAVLICCSLLILPYHWFLQ